MDLLSKCLCGERCSLGDGARPAEATATRTVRASFIRFLALGGDADNPVHEEGVMLEGAWVAGELNLHHAKATARLDLRNCHFELTPIFVGANLPELGFIGCAVPGLTASSMIVQGGVFLKQGFVSNGPVNLAQAQIGGNLECANACFANPEGDAINADIAIVAGSIFLNAGFQAIGRVCLIGTQIGQSLQCANGQFTSFLGSAVCADRMVVKGGGVLSQWLFCPG